VPIEETPQRTATGPNSLLGECGMRYSGVNRMAARGVRTGTSLARTLRGYLETSLSDLIPPNTIACKIIDGDDYRGDDDFVEAEVTVNGRALVFHAEGAGDTDPKKANGLLGVMDRETGDTVSGPNDSRTWSRIEQLVRFASKRKALMSSDR
jgi:hypothetical protein